LLASAAEAFTRAPASLPCHCCCRLPAPHPALLSPAPPRAQLRLNAAQLEEKRAAEAAIDEVKVLLEAADGSQADASASSKEQLTEELAARQAKLDELMAGFEVRVPPGACAAAVVFWPCAQVGQRVAQASTAAGLRASCGAVSVCELKGKRVTARLVTTHSTYAPPLSHTHTHTKPCSRPAEAGAGGGQERRVCAAL
jgi:hypothetical protein